MADILDAAVESIASDDFNHVPVETLRSRLAAVRGTRLETRLHEEADTLIESVRYAITEPFDPPYGEFGHATQCTEPDGPGCRCNQTPVVAVSLLDSDSAHCIDHVQVKPLPLPVRSRWRDPFGVAYAD